MNQLHVTQKNVFELEIVFPSNEGLLANPKVSMCPFEVNFYLLPSAKFFGGTDNSDWLTKLSWVLNLEFDCVRTIHETLWSLIFHVKSWLLFYKSIIALACSINWLRLQVFIEIGRVLILDLQVLDVNDLLSRFVEEGVGSINWRGLRLILIQPWLLNWIHEVSWVS